jgi:hypothetical protein
MALDDTHSLVKQTARSQDAVWKVTVESSIQQRPPATARRARRI